MSWDKLSAVLGKPSGESKRRSRPATSDYDDAYERCMSGNVTRAKRINREDVRNSPETVLRPGQSPQ